MAVLSTWMPLRKALKSCGTFSWVELAVLEVPVRGTLSSPAETLVTVRRKQSSRMPVTHSCLNILQQRRDQAALGFLAELKALNFSGHQGAAHLLGWMWMSQSTVEWSRLLWLLGARTALYLGSRTCTQGRGELTSLLSVPSTQLQLEYKSLWFVSSLMTLCSAQHNYT